VLAKYVLYIYNMEGADMPDLLGGPQYNGGKNAIQRKGLNLLLGMLIGFLALYFFLEVIKLGINYSINNVSFFELLFENSNIGNLIFPVAIIIFLIMKNRNAAFFAILFGCIRLVRFILPYWYSDSWSDFLMYISQSGSQLLEPIFFAQFLCSVLIIILGILQMRKERKNNFEKF
jgi:hypothetical protein